MTKKINRVEIQECKEGIGNNVEITENLIDEDDGSNEIEELMERGFDVKEKNGEIVRFNANFFADYIKLKLKILYSNDNFFYIYENGVWTKKEDNEIFKILRDILQEPRFGVWSKRIEDEYVAALQREVYHPGDLNPRKDIINMKNGVYDIKNLKFLPHSSKYLSTIQIPVEYKENASCERFLKFINEVFEGDAERIAVAQEWFGYSMTTETKAQKALILFGSGANGKGVFTDILSNLIGDGNISNISLNELQKPFSRVCLHNKTANICNENEWDGKTFNTQYFKAIVGEDMITAEQKNKPVFSFKPTVKLIMSMNNLPSTKDKSKGYYRRLMILNFTAYFSEEKRDKDLKKKLKEELPGIFLWAVEGLERLRKSEFRFSECENMRQIQDDYEREQNPILEFFEECVKVLDNSSNKEENKVIYDSFISWAERNGHNGYASINTTRFWREFDAVARSKGIVTKSGHSNSVRYHTGIRILPAYKEIVKSKPIASKKSKSSMETYLEVCKDDEEEQA